jgi:transcriptional regulator with XRE-family HTH domain
MDNNIIGQVMKLAEAKGEKPTVSMKAAGVGKNFFANIRSGSTPSVDKINKLAAYFNVSTDYILGIENPAAPDREQPDREIISLANRVLGNLSEDELQEVLKYVDYVKSQRK